MNTMGMRCSNSDFTYAAVRGTKAKPKLVDCKSMKYPAGYQRPQSLKWFLQEIETLYTKYSVDAVVMKRYEGKTRGNAYEARVEHEAIVYLACANCGIKHVLKKVERTIAKDLGLKGQAHYLRTSLDTTIIPGFKRKSRKSQDAILAAWSALH